MTQINRRAFLRAGIALGAGAAFAERIPAGEPAGKGAPNAEKLGWRLGCQAWCFNKFTFHDAVAKTASLGLHYIEAYPRQPLSRGKRSVVVGPDMLADDRKDLKKHLSDNGVQVVSIGVGPYSRAMFDFAKEMGIENIVSEPKFQDFDQIDKLCEEYAINLAIHDHPKPSPYWNPDTVLEHVKGHSKRIGACCDTGHWMRSGVNVLEALKKLEGRIIEFHFKDLNVDGRDGRDVHDVPWGTGKGDPRAWMVEVKRQGIKPLFNAEYEYHFENSLPEIAQCVAYFDKVAGELAGNGA
jgi:sugar phosphate isomerase/epimerase